jgi:hyaluronate lyase
MAFTLRAVTGSSLHGRKSWFFFGDRILALGAGIADGGDGTETVVDNRRIGRTARLLVDGEPLPTGRRQGARWAWLEDAGTGSRIGYVFPAGATLHTLREERSGSWRAINDQQGAATVTGRYQSLAIPHGAPDYAYLLLPDADEAATRAAASDPAVRVDGNDDVAAAAEDLRRHAWFANLWRAGTARRAGRAYVAAGGPAAVLVTEAGGGLRVNVADPTQRQATLEVRLLCPVGELLAASPGVAVERAASHVVLRIATAGAAGAGFQAEFGPSMP